MKLGDLTPSSVVYVRAWALYVHVPDRVFHARGRWTFPTYSSDPGSKLVQYRDGEERGETRCSRLIEKSVSRPEDGRRWDRPTGRIVNMVPIRLDVAECIARPCRSCFDVPVARPLPVVPRE